MERSLILVVRAAIVTLAVIFTQNVYAQSPTSDHADLLVTPSFITISGDALKADDGSESQAQNNIDKMELDLSDVGSMGTTYTVRWRRDPVATSESVNKVEESANAAAEIPFTSSNTANNDAVSNNSILLYESLRVVNPGL